MRAIYVGLLFSDELEVLKVAVDMYLPHVAGIDLLQSSTTLSGRPKRPSLAHNPWRGDGRVRLHTLHNLTRRKSFTKENWTVETQTRRHVGRLLRARRPRPFDCLFFPDVDELVHPTTLVRACNRLRPNMAMQFDLMWFHTSPWQLALPNTWNIIAMTTAKALHRLNWDCGAVRANSSTLRLRFEHRAAREQCYDGETAPIGWHCSWCFRNRSQFISKMRASSHVRYARFAGNEKVLDRMMCEGWWLNVGPHGKLHECRVLPPGNRTLTNDCALERLSTGLSSTRRNANATHLVRALCALTAIVVVRVSCVLGAREASVPQRVAACLFVTMVGSLCVAWAIVLYQAET